MWVPGGTYFFTVNLLERRRRLLVDRIGDLRTAFQAAHVARPFEVLAIVVLPDHLHCEHLIRDEDDLRRHVDYIHFNPVKHGHAVRALDWPHSSFRRWVKRGEYPVDWGG